MYTLNANIEDLDLFLKDKFFLIKFRFSSFSPDPEKCPAPDTTKKFWTHHTAKNA